jgi:hypothetical protein
MMIGGMGLCPPKPQNWVPTSRHRTLPNLQAPVLDVEERQKKEDVSSVEKPV